MLYLGGKVMCRDGKSRGRVGFGFRFDLLEEILCWVHGDGRVGSILIYISFFGSYVDLS